MREGLKQAYSEWIEKTGLAERHELRRAFHAGWVAMGSKVLALLEEDAVELLRDETDPDPVFKETWRELEGGLDFVIERVSRCGVFAVCADAKRMVEMPIVRFKTLFRKVG